VVFFAGYPKWYRFMLQRLAHSFGSPNFGTESSTCHFALVQAWKDLAGQFVGPDQKNANTYFLWAANPFYSKYVQVKGLYAAKERGQKIVVIDPRRTPSAEKLADLYLQIKPGTDAALALGMAKIIIDNNWVNQEYIDKYVYGYDEYKKAVAEYDIDRVAEITGLKKDDIFKAAELYACNGPTAVSESGAPLVHHRNGYQTFKAIMSLTVICGFLDRNGGMKPVGETFSHQYAGFEGREHEFIHATAPTGCRERMGARRYPLWEKLMEECQMTDFVRQFETSDPYELKAFMGFGFNNMMLPQSHKLLEVLDKMEFVCNMDLFMTNACKHSDLVLPACTAFEREEFKVYPNGTITYITPVISTVGESRSDADVIADLVKVLKVDDPLLGSGYRNCVEWIFKDCNFTVDECIKSDMPISVKTDGYVEGAWLDKGLNTPSGKIELYSNTIKNLGRDNLNPLPVFEDPYDEQDKSKYSFIISSGARIPYCLHSRAHDIPWLRSLRKDPTVDINDEDAKSLGIEQNDWVLIENDYGKIRVRANVTSIQLKGTLCTYHGRKDADSNELVGINHLCPYSGYPGCNHVQVNIKKEVR